MSQIIDLSGYHLTFDDEFDSPADLKPFDNTFFWGGTTITPNGELENYVSSTATTDNPYSVANGALTITASPTPSGGLPYTSGLLTTQNSFSQNTGYFEIRAEMPQNSGFWPAFWMLPEGAGYPEIDILEQPDGSGNDTEYFNHTSTPTDSSGGFQNVGTDVFAGYHTYGFLWTATTIQYTFDGQLIGTPQTTPPALAAEQMYLLANLAVGGWAEAPPSGASSTYGIDYIRAYSDDPGVPAVTQEAVSNPVTAVSLDGQPGDDVFQAAPGQGDFDVRGSGDSDSIAFSGVDYAQAQISGTGSAFNVAISGTTISGGNIGSMSFIDGALTYDPNSVAAEILRLYQAALGRAPDSIGLASWVQSIDQGTSLTSVANGFLGSSEFQALYPDANDPTAFVTQLYQNVLGRAPDTTGLSSWVSSLTSGAQTQAQVLLGFSNSQENIANTAPTLAAGLYVPNADATEVSLLYYAALNRAPDLAGLTGWTQDLENGSQTLQQIAAGFTGSTEFQASYGANLSNQAFVSLMYKNVLGRAPDPAGAANWVDAMNNGTSQAGVLLGFSQSLENTIKMAPISESNGIKLA